MKFFKGGFSRQEPSKIAIKIKLKSVDNITPNLNRVVGKLVSFEMASRGSKKALRWIKEQNDYNILRVYGSGMIF